MDDNWLLVLIVVENHDLEQSAGSIRADDQVPSLAGDHAERVAQSVVNVLIQDAVLSRAVRYLHDKVTLSTWSVKVALSTRWDVCPVTKNHGVATQPPRHWLMTELAGRGRRCSS